MATRGVRPQRENGRSQTDLLIIPVLLLFLPGMTGASCCYLAKNNLMCHDVCELILASKSDSHLKHLLQRAPEYCPESMWLSDRNQQHSGVADNRAADFRRFEPQVTRAVRRLPFGFIDTRLPSNCFPAEATHRNSKCIEREVWGCINSSLPGVLKKSDGWVGLGCCELAIAVECRQACKQASSKNDILKICRKEYEVSILQILFSS
ncbi:reversion-inducing cysteine-rich protein with Kazal motifs-like isoform X3 [Crotalus tigris]|uniref:reversion-inducing cysteine-rich protein with Kazal motifs-like isoform X3 n=1 Tax=Crotalus tigris TaxID=88082 RepID=UPI00192FA196|nr:reversion-inducing cysteine-rich protein with Kazal motifs-like isoform X3 [Crotalus tigris]